MGGAGEGVKGDREVGRRWNMEGKWQERRGKREGELGGGG